MPTLPSVAVYPGSFDPITLGHVNIIERAAEMFDTVHVAILSNSAKSGMFSMSERRSFVDQATEHLPQVSSVSYSGRLLVDVCAELGARIVIKGLRGGTDFAYETPMARMNHHLAGLETLFLLGSAELEHVSSSLIKDVALGGGDITGLVPCAVAEALTRKREERA